MKKLFAILTLLTVFSFSVRAQSKGEIKGLVIDGSQKTIEAATISLLKAKDSVAIKFTVANKDGQFLFEGIADGQYIVSVSAVGHQSAFSPVFEINPASSLIQLKTIELIPQSKTMGGVVVTARKPFIEQKMDRMIVNVDASITNVGATALEVLEKSPGVTVDKDGNISLKGKQGIMVMMDGRPSYLTGTELTNYLKNLPASALDQIEIMTNPPAKYDAAGNAGIINIKTKKNKIKGFNGNLSLSYGQGIYWKTNNSINVNFRTEKINVFANASQSVWNGAEVLEIKRTYRDSFTKNTTHIFEQMTNMYNGNKSYNLKIGADYYITKNTTLGIVTSGFINPEKFHSGNTSYLMNPNRVVDSIVYADSKNDNQWKNGSINLNFRHQFDSTGTELTADADYITYSSKAVQSFVNTSYDPTWIKKMQREIASTLPINISIYSAKVDYSHPFKTGLKLEAGAKASFVKTTNSAFYYTVAGGEKFTDYTKTNQFLYNENINAAYVNLSKEFGKWGLQTGLRFENTNYDGKQYGNPTKTDSVFKRSYGNLFPTVYVSYNASQKNQFGLSVGRRIERPAYQDLNPFLFFLDEYTYESGNPFIRPQFTNNLELTHTYNSFLTTTLNYSHTKDYMLQTFSPDGYATVVRKANIGKVDAAGIAINAQITVTKWWNTNLYSNLNYSRYQGDVQGEGKPIDVKGVNVLFNVNNQFKFAKTWSAELSGFYRTKGIEGQILINPLGQASFGIGKQIMKEKATVKLNLRDIFLTNRATGNINFTNLDAWFKNSHDSRVATLSFTYRFGKPLKGAQPRRKNSGAQEEQNRVKMGGNN